jgi:hypothetical protein
MSVFGSLRSFGLEGSVITRAGQSIKKAGLCTPPFILKYSVNPDVARLHFTPQVTVPLLAD